MDALIEIGKQVPALAVLVWLVYFFFGHLKAEREHLTTLTESSNAANTKSASVIEKATAIMARAEVWLERLDEKHNDG